MAGEVPMFVTLQLVTMLVTLLWCLSVSTNSR